MEAKIPVILVITKGFTKKNARTFKKKIEELNLECRSIVPVLAQQYEEIDEDDEEDILIIHSYGLDKLVELTYEILPEGVKMGFNNVQKVNIEQKIKEARTWMLGYIAGCGVIGLSPIPFSDRALLTYLISAIAGISGAALTGKTLVSNLLKFIPGAGTVVGGAISASVAAAITTALGLAYINVLKYILEEEAKGVEVTNDEIVEKMKSEFKKEIKISTK